MRPVGRVRMLRPLVLVLLIALAAALAIVAVGSGARTGSVEALDTPPLLPVRSATASPKLEPRRLQQAGIAWRGGPILTSTGETVNVLVSEAFAVDAVTPESWAEFLVKLVHGTELAQLTTYIAPLAEIRTSAAAAPSGATRETGRSRSARVLPDGTTPEEVVRHEYGHHIALYRSNPPWRAIEWGPKNWASAAGVCAKVAGGDAYPGDEDEHYAQNPGEAWAEVYRLMDERKVGITTARWQIIAPTFYPTRPRSRRRSETSSSRGRPGRGRSSAGRSPGARRGGYRSRRRSTGRSPSPYGFRAAACTRSRWWRGTGER